MVLRRSIALLAVAVLALASCGDDEQAGGADEATIVVTTSVLGDVVASMVGDLAEVETIMEAGTNPHDFQPSAQQIDAMTRADALVVNGAGFEEGLADTIEAAERDGTPVHEAISDVSTLPAGGHSHDHEDHEDHEAHEDEEHGHEDHEGEEHSDGAADPHFFTDPARMIDAVAGIGDFLAGTVPALDTDAFRARVDDYTEELADLDSEVEEILAAVPEERRVLVTNHEVFGYFADRYDFEVVGTVIPASSTSEGASAGDLAALTKVIEDEGVPAIFSETSSRREHVETLSSEVGADIEIVELFTESLGGADSDAATYPDMLRVNARRIAAALG